MLPDGVNVTPVTASEWPQNLINNKIVDKNFHYSKFRMYKTAPTFEVLYLFNISSYL